MKGRTPSSVKKSRLPAAGWARAALGPVSAEESADQRECRNTLEKTPATEHEALQCAAARNAALHITVGDLSSQNTAQPGLTHRDSMLRARTEDYTGVRAPAPTIAAPTSLPPATPGRVRTARVDPNRRARRRLLRERLPEDAVHGGEVREVREVHVDLHHVRPLQPRLSHRGLQPAEHGPELRLERRARLRGGLGSRVEDVAASTARAPPPPASAGRIARRATRRADRDERDLRLDGARQARDA